MKANSATQGWLRRRIESVPSARSLVRLMTQMLLTSALCLRAASLPAGFSETPVPGPSAGNWNEAVGITFSPAGRMFVWERNGRVWFRDASETNFTQLLDLSEEVAAWGDHGCLGFTLDPNFSTNGYIYLLYAVDRHHLLYYGTPNYNASSNEYTAASIGRVTRYTCAAADDFRSVTPASRLVLLGETKTNGFPLCSDSHGVGSLLFGRDGTLLVSCGDGATAWQVDTGGTASGSFAPQALSDGIIRAKENVGAYRAQLVDCLSGKILRIDPATGNGVPSNPFYDPANPKAAKSRVWAVGCRNAFRIALRPGTGSLDPAEGNPGSIYIGNVGWDDWESLQVCDAPGQNFGWPLFDGMEITPDFVLGGTYNVDVNNLDAPNPLHPGGGCSQYFSFRQLLKQHTTNPTNFPPFNNPCNASVKIPTNIPQFLHTLPVLDWNHNSPITRTPTYATNGTAIYTNIGVAGSPVSGTAFRGNCAVGGIWLTNASFPAPYRDRYYFADWGFGPVKTLAFDTNDRPVALGDFATNAGAIVALAEHPLEGALYYLSYNYAGATMWKVTYTTNRPPVAVASASPNSGPTPLNVQFSSAGSSDPDGQPITYAWNFGDGSPTNTLANPAHTFLAPAGVPLSYLVTLTVIDSGGLSAQTTLTVLVNPPPASAANFTNAAPVTIVDNSAGTPYPATLDVAIGGTITSLSVTLRGLSHGWGNDVDVLLVGPGGQKVTLMSDAGTGPIANANLTFSNGAAATLPATGSLVTGTFRPTDYAPADTYPAPAPAGPYGTNLTVFHGLSASGVWSLYVMDDGPGDSGSIANGWILNLTTTNPPTQAPGISDIADQTTPFNTPTAQVPFTVSDPDTAASNLVLSASSANPTLIPTNNIVFGGSESNRTVTVTPATNQSGSALITVTVSDGVNTASDTFTVTVSGVVAGVVRDSATLLPIAGALVSLQATTLRTNTAPDGSYSLPITNGTGLVIVAARKGYYNQSVLANVPATSADILLEAVPQGQDTNYAFVSPQSCANCHPDQHQQWQNTPMAKAGRNTWVHDLYSGKGTPGGTNGFYYLRDSAFAASNPASECAACHEPENWVKSPFSAMRDPTLPPTDATLHGVSCEVCHKIADVDVQKINFAGIFPGAVTFTLPGSNLAHQVEYGVLGDANIQSGMMRASYQPQLVAEVCGVCHQDATDVAGNHTFTGPISEPTYLEWSASPYGNTNSPLYTTCVDCHMPPSGANTACDYLPVTRSTNTIRSHTIEGTTPRYLDNAVELAMTTQVVGTNVQVQVTVTNSLTGHHVPTGVTIRNMVLLVEAWRASDGLPLEHTGAQTIHPLGGVGDPAQGYYAGLPGKLYTKLIHDVNTNAPVFFTEATGIIFDNRIPPLAGDSTSYTFAAPPGSGVIHIRSRLIYRRSFPGIVDAKGWTQDGHGNPLADKQPPHFGHLMESAEQYVGAPTLSAQFLDSDHLHLTGYGVPGVAYTIQTSTNLQSWQYLGIATTNGIGSFQFVDPTVGGSDRRFYRAVSP